MPANSFSNTQIQTARYFYEKIPYTLLDTSLAPGYSPVFSINNVSKADRKIPKMAILSDVAVTNSHANVSVQVGHSDHVVQGDANAYPGSLTPVLTGKNEGVRSDKRLSFAFANSSGAAIANFQSNYAVAVKELTTADKVLRGLPLTTEDLQYQHKFNIQNQGLRPLALSRSLDQIFKGQILDETAYMHSVQASSTSNTAIENLVPNAGEMLIVTSIQSAATLGNMVNITMDRDGDMGYVSILADNMTMGAPFDMWLPVLKNLNLAIGAQITTNNVPVLITVLRVKLSTAIQVLFGELSASEVSDRDGSLSLYQNIRAGVLA